MTSDDRGRASSPNGLTQAELDFLQRGKIVFAGLSAFAFVSMVIGLDPSVEASVIIGAFLGSAQFLVGAFDEEEKHRNIGNREEIDQVVLCESHHFASGVRP